MNLRVVDTNVFSYLFKEHPLADAYRPLLQGKEWLISFMSLAELAEGAERAEWDTEKRGKLEVFLRPFTVIHSTVELCGLWGQVRACTQKQPFSVADAWIAATALAYSCPLVTHNPGDFGGIPGLQVLTVAKDEAAQAAGRRE